MRKVENAAKRNQYIATILKYDEDDEFTLDQLNRMDLIELRDLADDLHPATFTVTTHQLGGYTQETRPIPRPEPRY